MARKLSRCTSLNNLVLAFIKIKLYVVLVMVSIIGVIYITSIIPVEIDIVKIVILGLLTIAVLYIWYKITLLLMKKFLNRIYK